MSMRLQVLYACMMYIKLKMNLNIKHGKAKACDY